MARATGRPKRQDTWDIRMQRVWMTLGSSRHFRMEEADFVACAAVSTQKETKVTHCSRVLKTSHALEFVLVFRSSEECTQTCRIAKHLIEGERHEICRMLGQRQR